MALSRHHLHLGRRLPPGYDDLPDEFWLAMEGSRASGNRAAAIVVMVTVVPMVGTVIWNWPLAVGVVAGAVLLFYGLFCTGGKGDEERCAKAVQFVPYFEREVAGPDTFRRGHALALAWKYLERLVARHGLTGLAEWLSSDPEWEGKPLIWFDAISCRQETERLMAAVQADEQRPEFADELIIDLQHLRDRLLLAETENTRFCLHMRIAPFVCAQEFSVRKGYY